MKLWCLTIAIIIINIQPWNWSYHSPKLKGHRLWVHRCLLPKSFPDTFKIKMTLGRKDVGFWQHRRWESFEAAKPSAWVFRAPWGTVCDALDDILSGWWFGTFFIFPYIGNLIIPIDFHIFQRGGPTTNQLWLGRLYPKFPQTSI